MSHSILVWLLLSILWCLLWQDFDISIVLFGMVLAALVVAAQSRSQQRKSLWGPTRAWTSLLMFLIWEFTISSLRVAWDVITPRHRSCPLVIEYPLRLREPNHIAIFSSAITLTPGTLTIDDHSRDGTNYLLVHLLYADDPQAAIASIRELEELILACFDKAAMKEGVTS